MAPLTKELLRTAWNFLLLAYSSLWDEEAAAGETYEYVMTLAARLREGVS